MDTIRTSEAIDQDRRRLLATAAMGVAIAGTANLLPSQLAAAATSDAIRPFTVHFPDDEIAGLRQRIAATRWPGQETVTDATQGVQLAVTQKLARYWGTE